MGRRDDGEVTKLPPALRKLRRWDNSHEHWNTQPGTTGRCAILPPLAGKRTGGAVWPLLMTPTGAAASNRGAMLSGSRRRRNSDEEAG